MKQRTKGTSNYPFRLQRRGETSRSVRMIDYVHVGVHPDGMPGKDASAAQRELVSMVSKYATCPEHNRHPGSCISAHINRKEGKPEKVEYEEAA